MIWILRDLHRTYKKSGWSSNRIWKIVFDFSSLCYFFPPSRRHPSRPARDSRLYDEKNANFLRFLLPLVWWFLFHHTRWSFIFLSFSFIVIQLENIFCCFFRMVGSIDRRWRCAYDVYTWNMYTDDFNHAQWIVQEPPNRDEIRSFFGFIGFIIASP